MKHIAFTGGNIARHLTSNRTHYLKPDRSVLTEADVEISRLARTTISDLLTTPDHILIDEEDTENNKYLDQSNLEAPSFIWAIDPIDGTRAFSNGMPNFGISVGLLKGLKLTSPSQIAIYESRVKIGSGLLSCHSLQLTSKPYSKIKNHTMHKNSAMPPFFDLLRTRL